MARVLIRRENGVLRFQEDFSVKCGRDKRVVKRLKEHGRLTDPRDAVHRRALVNVHRPAFELTQVHIVHACDTLLRHVGRDQLMVGEVVQVLASFEATLQLSLEVDVSLSKYRPEQINVVANFLKHLLSKHVAVKAAEVLVEESDRLRLVDDRIDANSAAQDALITAETECVRKNSGTHRAADGISPLTVWLAVLFEHVIDRLSNVVNSESVVYLRGHQLGAGIATPTDHADVVGLSTVECLRDK